MKDYESGQEYHMASGNKSENALLSEPIFGQMPQYLLEVGIMASKGRSGYRVVAAVGLLAACAGIARAGAYRAEWDELEGLLKDKEVTIALPGGGSLTGEVFAVRPDSLSVNVGKVSGAKGYARGPNTISRESVTTIRVTDSRRGWGRWMGMLLGQIGGLVGGIEVAIHGTDSEGAAMASFLAVDCSATVAGYYIGRAGDRRTMTLQVSPASRSGAGGNADPVQ